MKHYKQSLWAIIFAIFTLAACQKDSFSGTDNYMLEFSLQGLGEEVFSGEIADNIIQVDLPANIQTDKLRATYTVSELATILPNPKTVNNWTDEQSFTVTSYNGTARQYTVKIKKNEMVSNQNVYLRTDEEVAAFAAKKIAVINGNLTIGAPMGADSISNIDALEGLKEVRYKLVINTTYKGSSLSGLKELKKAGSIVIDGEFKQLRQIELPKIEKIQADLVVISKEITNLSLPKLTETENIRLKLSKLDKLNIEQLQRVSELELKGTFEWYEQSATTLKSLKLPHLVTVDKFFIDKLANVKELDLSSLEGSSRYMYIHNMTDMEILRLDKLKEANDLGLAFDDALKTLRLPSLEKVGVFNVKKCNMLKVIQLPKLSVIDKQFALNANPELTDLSAINKLKNVEAIVITGVPKLTSLNVLLSSIETMNTLSVDNLPMVTEEIELSHIEISGNVIIVRCFNISGINLPKKIGDTFELNLASNDSQTKLPKITGLEECAKFMINNAPGVKKIIVPTSLKKLSTQLYAYGGMTEVVAENLEEAGEINVYSNDLASLSFPNLKKVTGKLVLFGKLLETVNIAKLVSVGRIEIGGSYSGWQNEKLTNLDFLTSLTSLETLEIKFCKFLTDYLGLKKAVDAGSITAEKWTTETVHDNAYNPTFEDLKAGRYVKP